MFISSLVRYRVVEMDDLLKDTELLSTARSLTLYPTSGMNKALDYYQMLLKEQHIDAKAIFAIYEDKTIGWMLLTHEWDSFYFNKADGHACIHVYVHPEYRRLKVGSGLVEMGKRIFPTDQISCYAHNNPSFFQPFIDKGFSRVI